MNTHKALFASKLTLVTILLFTALRVVLPLGSVKNGPAPASAQDKGSAQAVKPTHSVDLSLENYAQIAQKNPFGTSGSGQWSLTDDSFGLDHSVSDQLGLALFGTVSGSPSVARAIIKDLKTGVCNLYKVGQMIGSARIEGIEKDAVILFHDEQRKILGITAWESDSGDNNHASSSLTGNEQGKLTETDLAVGKTYTDAQTKIKQIEQVLTKALIEPYVVNGQTQGLKITGLENIKSTKRFGLKNGDVLRTVNGHLLTSTQKAYQIFKKAKSQKDMTVELLRDDKPKKISFDLW